MDIGFLSALLINPMRRNFSNTESLADTILSLTP